MRSSYGQMATLNLGFATDIFRFGDFDGDGKNDIGAVRNEGGAYFRYAAQSSNGFRANQWEQAGDR